MQILTDLGSLFKTSRSSRKGDIIITHLVFISDLERAVDKIKKHVNGIAVQGLQFKDQFVNDMNDLTLRKTKKILKKLQALNNEQDVV